jgi:hypothetical protein
MQPFGEYHEIYTNLKNAYDKARSSTFIHPASSRELNNAVIKASDYTKKIGKAKGLNPDDDEEMDRLYTRLFGRV